MEWLHYSAYFVFGCCMGILLRSGIDRLCDMLLGTKAGLAIIPANLLCGLTLGVLYDYVDMGEMLDPSSFLTMSSGFLGAMTIWPIFNHHSSGPLLHGKDLLASAAFLSSNVGIFGSVFLGMWLGKALI